MTATIYLGSTAVRKIWSGKALATGSHTWTWNGKTSSGRLRQGRHLSGPA